MKLEKLKVMFLLYSVAEPSFFGGIYIFKSPFIFFCHLYVIPFFKKKHFPFSFLRQLSTNVRCATPPVRLALVEGRRTAPPAPQVSRLYAVLACL